MIQSKAVLLLTLDLVMAPYIEVLSGRKPGTKDDDRVRATRALDAYIHVYDRIKGAKS